MSNKWSTVLIIIIIKAIIWAGILNRLPVMVGQFRYLTFPNLN